MSVAVITTKSGNATFNASTNAISTSTQQVAGAPYCYISDTLDIYKEIAGTDTWQNESCCRAVGTPQQECRLSRVWTAVAPTGGQ